MLMIVIIIMIAGILVVVSKHRQKTLPLFNSDSFSRDAELGQKLMNCGKRSS